ncbi:MAG: holo-ACP synthase [Bacillota bacterium]
MITKIDGIGIDIVEIKEIEAKLSNAFINRILSQKELAYFNTITHSKRKLQYLAGRFAGKEAYTKAYGSFDTPLNFKDVSILHDANNAPYIISSYRPHDIIKISISHSKTYATAIVMVDRQP